MMDRLIITKTDIADRIVVRDSELAATSTPPPSLLASPANTADRQRASMQTIILALCAVGFVCAALGFVGSWTSRPRQTFPPRSAEMRREIAEEVLGPQHSPPPIPSRSGAGDTASKTLKDLFAEKREQVVVLLTRQGTGAGVSLLVDPEGVLIGTARHTVASLEPEGLAALSTEVMLSFGELPRVTGRVVGLHGDLDLALLWVPGRHIHSGFRQPILSASEIEVAEPIWVIGHPLGQTYSLSDGKITRGLAAGALQFNAPISSGNSGGPLYDFGGNLLGIVSTGSGSVPRGVVAQNLNFAVRADAFLHDAGWNLDKIGRAKFPALPDRTGGGDLGGIPRR